MALFTVYYLQRSVTPSLRTAKLKKKGSNLPLLSAEGCHTQMELPLVSAEGCHALLELPLLSAEGCHTLLEAFF